MKKLPFILLFLMSFKLFAIDPWYQDKKRGWYYYEESKDMEEIKEDIAKDQKVNLENAPEIIESEKEKTHRLLCLALLRPTEENISNYIYQQNKLIYQSSKFASTWKAALLSDPNLTFNLPKTDYAQLLQKAQEYATREERLDNYKKEHFLLFVFKGADFSSKELSSVISHFSKRKDWKVQAVSVDGLGVEEFPNFEFDRGISEAIGHKTTPSLYVVHPEKNYILPIGSGIIDEESIEKNIDFQMLRMGDKNHAL